MASGRTSRGLCLSAPFLWVLWRAPRRRTRQDRPDAGRDGQGRRRACSVPPSDSKAAEPLPAVTSPTVTAATATAWHAQDRSATSGLQRIACGMFRSAASRFAKLCTTPPLTQKFKLSTTAGATAALSKRVSEPPRLSAVSRGWWELAEAA